MARVLQVATTLSMSAVKMVANGSGLMTPSSAASVLKTLQQVVPRKILVSLLKPSNNTRRTRLQVRIAYTSSWKRKMRISNLMVGSGVRLMVLYPKTQRNGVLLLTDQRLQVLLVRGHR